MTFLYVAFYYVFYDEVSEQKLHTMHYLADVCQIDDIRWRPIYFYCNVTWTVHRASYSDAK